MIRYRISTQHSQTIRSRDECTYAVVCLRNYWTWTGRRVSITEEPCGLHFRLSCTRIAMEFVPLRARDIPWSKVDRTFYLANIAECEKYLARQHFHTFRKGVSSDLRKISCFAQHHSHLCKSHLYSSSLGKADCSCVKKYGLHQRR